MEISYKASGHARSQKGFTLLEVMVSTGVGIVLLGIVLTILQVGGQGYGRTARRIDTNVEARSALRIFYDDLSALQFDDYFGLNSDSGTDWPSDEIWFMSLMPRTAQESSKASGDLCFVYYYTAVTGPDDLNTGPFTRKLYRRLISSADVMKVLKGEAAPDSLGLAKPLGDPTPEPSTRVEDEAIAFNVVQFRIEALTINDAGGRDRWTRTAPTNGGAVDDEKPDLIKITLRVADNETAGLLTKAEDWEAGGGALAKEFLGTEAEEGKRLRTFEMTIPCGR